MEQNRANLEESGNIGKWKTKKAYLIALVSWISGLNSIIHIPEIFLKGNILDYIITYVPMVILMGIPLTLMELSISQYSKMSLKSWDLCPLFRGIGYSKIVLVYVFQIYYNVLNGYMLLYACSAFSKSLIWNSCNASWANSSCYDPKVNTSLQQGTSYQTSAEQFWFHGVLSFKEDNTQFLEPPGWEPVLYLSINMLIVFLIIREGTKYLKHVLPYTMLVSSIGIIILTCAIVTTAGSMTGLNQIFKMEIHGQILVPWGENSMVTDAFRYTLLSMGIGLGGLSSLATQSSFRSPVYIFAILLNLINIGLTVIYAIIIFGLYGTLSRNTKMGIDEIIQRKSKFANNVFTVIPSAIVFLPGNSQMWVFIFYFSMFLKGLSCSTLMAHTILQSLYEIKPNLMEKSVICSFVCSLFICLPGFILYTNVGIIISTYLKEITYTSLLPLINCCQTVAIVFVYGLENLSNDLCFMLGYYPSAYWRLSLIGTSIFLPIFTFNSIRIFSKVYHYNQFNFMNFLHNFLLSTVLFWIPFMASARIIQKRIWKDAIQPSEYWTPRHSEAVQRSRKYFVNQNLICEYIYSKHLLKNKLKKYEK